MATSEFEDQEDETIKFINPTATASTSTVIADGTIFLHILNYKKFSETRKQLYSPMPSKLFNFVGKVV